MTSNPGEPEGAGPRRTVEVRARTVQEAVARGLVRLGGLGRSEVDIEVLSEGKGGLLGFGAEEALVRLTAREPGASAAEGAAGGAQVTPDAVAPTAPPAPVEEASPAAEPERRPSRGRKASEPPSPPETVAVKDGGGELAVAQVEAQAGVAADLGALEATARRTVARYLELLGYEDVEVVRGVPLLPPEVEDEDESTSLVLDLRGSGTRKLLARDGRSLLALQFLVRLAVNRDMGTWVNLLLDVDGDRARRVKEIYHLAEQSAELVDREGRPVSLPPMTPYERRVVHLALRDHPTVTTQSIGKADARKVTVRLKGQLLQGV